MLAPCTFGSDGTVGVGVGVGSGVIMSRNEVSISVVDAVGGDASKSGEYSWLGVKSMLTCEVEAVDASEELMFFTYDKQKSRLLIQVLLCGARIILTAPREAT